MSAETLEVGSFTIGQIIGLVAFTWTLFAAIPGGHAIAHRRVAWTVAVLALYPFGGIAYYAGGIVNRLGRSEPEVVSGQT